MALLTQAVVEKSPLNGCLLSCSSNLAYGLTQPSASCAANSKFIPEIPRSLEKSHGVETLASVCVFDAVVAATQSSTYGTSSYAALPGASPYGATQAVVTPAAAYTTPGADQQYAQPAAAYAQPGKLLLIL